MSSLSYFNSPPYSQQQICDGISICDVLIARNYILGPKSVIVNSESFLVNPKRLPAPIYSCNLGLTDKPLL